jgi:hypothetical protein
MTENFPKLIYRYYTKDPEKSENTKQDRYKSMFISYLHFIKSRTDEIFEGIQRTKKSLKLQSNKNKNYIRLLFRNNAGKKRIG